MHYLLIFKEEIVIQCNIVEALAVVFIAYLYSNRFILVSMFMLLFEFVFVECLSYSVLYNNCTEWPSIQTQEHHCVSVPLKYSLLSVIDS